MNSVTIALPSQWEPATSLIVRFLANPRRLKTALLKGFKVKVSPSHHQDRIFVAESTLDTAQALFCDAAISAMNTALLATTSEGWRATKEVTEQAQQDVADIESIRAQVPHRSAGP